jgi:hypothetical protein
MTIVYKRQQSAAGYNLAEDVGQWWGKPAMIRNPMKVTREKLLFCNKHRSKDYIVTSAAKIKEKEKMLR